MTRKALPHIPTQNIIGEPCRRNTAAAAAVACGLVRKYGGDRAVGCILTADQLMTPETGFRRVLKDAVTAAAGSSSVVTMGIVPDYPATRFGYIEYADAVALKTRTGFRRVRRFVEKPDAKTAGRYFREGGYFWNSGMFVWRADSLAEAFAKAAPDIGGLIDKVAKAKNVDSLLKREYASVRAISFDYAVMEKAKNVEVVPGDFGWDDVGSFAAFDKYFPHDSRGNVREGPCTVVEADGNICVARSARISLLGVRNLVVVTTPDSVLVADKSRLTDMKKLFKR